MLFYFYHRLKDLLRTRLIECGWRDQLKQHCKGIKDVLFIDRTL